MRSALLLLPVLLVGCSSGDEPPAEERDESAVAEADVQVGASSQPPASGTDDETNDGAYRYTELEGCELLRENREEGGFFEHMCPGLGGYRLRLTESDLRQNLAVIAPDGTETDLQLGRVGGGGFSTLGGRVEWRGEAQGEEFQPDSFVVRYQVAEEPYPAPETSYLLAVRLTPTPCVTGKIAPGPQQNPRARIAADDPDPCLE